MIDDPDHDEHADGDRMVRERELEAMDTAPPAKVDHEPTAFPYLDPVHPEVRDAERRYHAREREAAMRLAIDVLSDPQAHPREAQIARAVLRGGPRIDMVDVDKLAPGDLDALDELLDRILKAQGLG